MYDYDPSDVYERRAQRIKKQYKKIKGKKDALKNRNVWHAKIISEPTEVVWDGNVAIDSNMNMFSYEYTTPLITAFKIRTISTNLNNAETPDDVRAVPIDLSPRHVDQHMTIPWVGSNNDPCPGLQVGDTVEIRFEDESYTTAHATGLIKKTENPGVIVPWSTDASLVEKFLEAAQGATTWGTAAYQAVGSFIGATAYASPGITLSTPEYDAISAAGEDVDAVPQNTDATTITLLNGSVVWPWRETTRNRSVTLVLFYHGTGYGTQDYALNDEDHGLIASINKIGKTISNTLFVIPKGNNPNWSKVKADLDMLQSQYAVTFTTKIMGGWSGGSGGGGKALLQTDHVWNSVLWADPSPQPTFVGSRGTLNESGNTYGGGKQTVYYNDANWGSYDFTTAGFATLAQMMTAIGNTTMAVSDNHNDILSSVFKIIGQQVS